MYGAVHCYSVHETHEVQRAERQRLTKLSQTAWCWSCMAPKFSSVRLIPPTCPHMWLASEANKARASPLPILRPGSLLSRQICLLWSAIAVQSARVPPIATWNPEHVLWIFGGGMRQCFGGRVSRHVLLPSSETATSQLSLRFKSKAVHLIRVPLSSLA